MPYSKQELEAQKAAKKAALTAAYWEERNAAEAAEVAAAEAAAAAAAAKAAQEAARAAQAAARAENLAKTKATAAVMPCGLLAADVSPAITPHTMAHIAEGEHNGNKSTGCHSALAVASDKAKIIDGTKQMLHDPPGIYAATVAVRKNDTEFYKEKFSTFFPDSWDEDKIKAEVTSAFNHKDKIIDPMDPNKWTAKSASGVIISGFTEEGTGNIASAFPTGDYVAP